MIKMKKLFNILILTLILILPKAINAANYESFTIPSGKKVDVMPGQVLVKFKKSVSAQRKSTVHAAFSARSTEIQPLDVELINIQPGQKVEDAVKQYENLPEVEYVEPNYIRKAFDKAPNDTNFSLQWGLNKMGVPSAWEKTTGSTAVIVAIVDSGVDYTHPDLAGNMWPGIGYDFIANNPTFDAYGNPSVPPTGDSDPKDEYGHGTHVAGIVAAVSNNAAGVCGVAGGFFPLPGCRIMAVRVLSNAGDGNDAIITQGIIYASTSGAKVINLSLGGPPSGKTLKAAIDYAAYGVTNSTYNAIYNNGCVIVAASGNGGPDGIGDPVVNHPAAYDNVIAVGASDSNDQRASFSDYGPELALVAPGLQIYSTMPTYTVAQNGAPENLPKNYSYMSGTSMATPMVSGVVALLLSKNPAKTPAEIRMALIDSAEKPSGYSFTNGWNREVGYGRVNAAAAFGILVPYVPAAVAKYGTNAPNPFSPRTGTTSIYLPGDMSTTSIIKLGVYNIAGEKVRTVEGAPGFKIDWDGKNDNGDIVADGMYLYSIESGGTKRTGKITVIK